MKNATSTIKSTCAKIIVALIACSWLGLFIIYYLGLAIRSLLIYFGIQNAELDFATSATATIIPMLFSSLIWKRCHSLDSEKIIDTWKATAGIIILTLALIAFPGTLIGPLAYGSIIGSESTARWTYLSLIGLPLSFLLYPAGFTLLFFDLAKKDKLHQKKSNFR